MGIPWRLICVFGFFSCVSTDNECLKCSDLSGFTEIQGSCYAPIVAKANRGDAIKECQKLHPKATLGTIRSAAQNAAVHDLAVNKLRAQCSSFSGEVWKNQMWIGFWDDLKDAKLANTWENDVKSDYRNWAPGQPKDDSGEEKGTAMTIVSGGPDPDGSWYDLHSQESVICGALCEILCDNIGASSCFAHSKTIVAPTCSGIWGFTDVGGSCYAPIYVNGNQAEAKAQCKKLHPDADLASIRCDAENEGIWKLSQGSFKDRCATHDPTNKYLDQLIIGKSNGDWIDCTNTTYSNWNAGEPNNAGGNEPVSTLFITNESPQFPKGKWNDLADGKFCAAMCELLVGTTGNSCGLKPCPGTQTCAASSGSSSGSPTPAPKKKTCPIVAGQEYTYISGFTQDTGSTDWCINWFSRSTYVNSGGARPACQESGGEVLSIHSDKDNQLLQGYISTDVTMGGYLDNGGTWRWFDGSPWNYSNWAPGEPVWGPSNNLHYWFKIRKSDGKWVSIGHDYTSYYAICRVKPIES